MTQMTVIRRDAVRRHKTLLALGASASLLACILLANYVTSRFGVVPVGFGLMATAGTYFAGLTFVLRDFVQDSSGKRWTWALIVAGAILSFFLADPFIAVASATAFLASEAADLFVYTPLRRRGYIRAALASNVVGAVVDTVIFLAIAGFSLQEAFAGQMVGKLVVTVAVVGIVVLVRNWRRSRSFREVRTGQQDTP